MMENRRLMTIWRWGANAPWPDLLPSAHGLSHVIRRYIVDGSDEPFCRSKAATITPRISNERTEVFTLACEVGALLTAPRPGSTSSTLTSRRTSSPNTLRRMTTNTFDGWSESPA
jgi:hypothetical protein